MRPDVVVVGAGIIGAACAHALAAEGLRVRILEARGLVAGASGAGQGALIGWDHATAASRAMAADGVGLWARLASELGDASGIDIGYRREGSLVVIGDGRADDGAELAGRLRTQGVRALLLDGRELREAEPLVGAAAARALLIPDDALLEPRHATLALLREARRRGATLAPRDPVRAIREDPDGVVVTTGSEACRAGWAVVAAGLDTPGLVQLLGSELPIRAVRGHVAVAVAPELSLTRFVTELAEPERSAGSVDADIWTSVQPTAAGPPLVGASRAGRPGVARSVDGALAGRLLERAARRVPALRAATLLRGYAGLRPASPDGTPFVGPVPGHPRVLVAAGHGGAGIMMAPSTAGMIRDLVLGRPPAIPAGPYALDRPAEPGAAP